MVIIDIKYAAQLSITIDWHTIIQKLYVPVALWKLNDTLTNTLGLDFITAAWSKESSLNIDIGVSNR